MKILIPLSPGLGIFSTSFGSSVFLDFEDFPDLALPIRLDFALPLLPLPLADVDRSFFFDAEPCLEFLRIINFFSGFSINQFGHGGQTSPRFSK